MAKNVQGAAPGAANSFLASSAQITGLNENDLPAPEQVQRVALCILSGESGEVANDISDTLPVREFPPADYPKTLVLVNQLSSDITVGMPDGLANEAYRLNRRVRLFARQWASATSPLTVTLTYELGGFQANTIMCNVAPGEEQTVVFDALPGLIALSVGGCIGYVDIAMHAI